MFTLDRRARAGFLCNEYLSPHMTLVYSTSAHACPFFLPFSSRMRNFPLTSRPLITRRCLTTLGLRREDPSRIWERRTPLTPHAVQSLLADAKDQLRVEVESCKRRCFPDAQYSDVSRHYAVKRLVGLPPLRPAQRLCLPYQRTWTSYWASKSPACLTSAIW